MQAVETLLVRFINILEAFANAVEKQDNRRKSGLTSEPELFNEHTRWIETMPVTFLEEHRVFVLDGVLPCVVSFFRTGIYSPDVHPKVEGMTESLRCALMKIFHSKEDGADSSDNERQTFLRLSSEDKSKVKIALRQTGLDGGDLNSPGKRGSHTPRRRSRSRSITNLGSISGGGGVGNNKLRMNKQEIAGFFFGNLSDFCTDVLHSSSLHAEMEDEFDLFAIMLLNSSSFTDPMDEEYCKRVTADRNLEKLDPRQVSITHDQVSCRMIRHALLHFPASFGKGESGLSFAVLKCFRRQLELTVPKEHLEPFFVQSNVLSANHHGLLDGIDETDEERMDREKRESELFSLQIKMSSWGLSRLLVAMIAFADKSPTGWDTIIHTEVLMLICRLVWDGNKEVQRDLVKVLEADRDGDFFAACHSMAQNDLRAIKSRHEEASWGSNSLRRMGSTSSRGRAREGGRGGANTGSLDPGDLAAAEQIREANRIDSQARKRSLMSCLMFKMLQLFCENHNHKMQELVHKQIHARQSFNLVEDAVLLLCALLPDTTVVKKHLTDEDLRLVSFLLDFLIESVQGPCSLNQEYICKSTAMAAITRLLPTSVESVLCVETGDIYSEVCVLNVARDPQPEEHIKNMVKPLNEKGLYHAYTPKHVKTQAVILLSGLIEGRQDYKLHNELMTVVDLNSVMRPCLVSTFLIHSCFTNFRIHHVGLHTHRDLRSLRYQTMNVEDEEDWESEYTQESYELLSLANSLAAAPGPLAAEYRKALVPQADLVGNLMNLSGATHSDGISKGKLQFHKLAECREKYARLRRAAKSKEPAAAIFALGIDFLQSSGAPRSDQFVRFERQAAELKVGGKENKTVQKTTEDLLQACLEALQELCYLQAYLFFQEGIKSVEVFWQGHLHRVYFPRPIQCAYLEDAAKAKMLQTLDISTYEDKAKDLLLHCQNLKDEMVHYEHLSEIIVPGLGISPYEVRLCLFLCLMPCMAWFSSSCGVFVIIIVCM